MSFITDLHVALRSLTRAKGLALTVIVTLALGIGANAAMFSVVQGVLLRPLVNRDEDRLIYIRQTARGMGSENANFSIPEIRDFQARVKTLTAFGDFSTIEFTMVGLGRAARGARRRRRRLVFRGDGAAPRARPPARRDRRRADGGRRGRADAPLLDDVAEAAIRPSSARRFGSAIARRPLSACSNRPCPIRRRRRSSRTWSRVRTISTRRWWTAACTG